MAGLFSSASSGSLATEAKVKLRLCFGGEFVQGPDGRWVYTGGSSYNESLPGALDYCQFMWKLSEKLNTAVSVKYQAPGEALDPDSLVSVGDDADVQELMEEYRNAQMRAGPGASSTLRIRVFAFPASEEELTAEEIEDGLIFMGEQSQYSRQTSRSGLERKSSLSSNSSCSHPSALPSSDTEFVLHNGLSAYTNTMHHMPSPLALDSSALAADRCHSWSEGTMQQFIARQLGRGLSKADAIMRQRNEQRSSSALAAAAAAAAGRSSGPSGGGTIGGGGGSGGMMSGGEAGGRAALLAAAAVAVASPRRGSGARAVVDGGKRQAAVGGAEPMQMTFADGSCPPDVYVEPRDMDDDELRYLFPSNLLSDNGGIGGDGGGVDAMAITPLHGGSRLVRLPSHISEFGDAPAQDDEAGQRGTWQEDGEGVNGVGGGGCGGGADDAGGRFKTQEIAMQDYEESLALLQPTHEFPLSPPRPPPPMLDLNGLGDPLTMSAGPVTDMIATPQLGAPAEGAGGGTAAPGGVVLARGVLPPPGGLAGGAGTQLRTHSASSHDRQVLTDTLPPVHCVNKADVKVLGKIGEGAFGEVLRASVPIFGQVAIKWLKSERFTKHSESFWKEAEVLSTLNHPNVLRFFGVVYDASQRGASPTDFAIVGIITEYVRGGSLAQLLRPSQPLLSLKARCALALHAVNGMQYLHEMKIVHFDLKPDNLLVDAGGSSSLSAQEAEAGGLCLKVADFGLSKHKANRFVSDCRDLRGTLPYMAPELVADPERVSEKADVWSMGVVMWEMLTREVPYQELTPQQILMGLMCGNLQLQIPEWCEPEWRGLLEACCEPNPGNRPSFAELQRQLTAIYEQQP